MKPRNLRNLTNSFLDARLVSLSTWREAHDTIPHENGGPYMVIEEGLDPESVRPVVHEYVLGKSGKWLSLAQFFRLPLEQRSAEYIFGSAAEVMELMQRLPPDAVMLRLEQLPEMAGASPTADSMVEAFQAGRKQGPGGSAKVN